MYYVYHHIRKDTNKPFYVGKGKVSKKHNRALITDRRTQWWKNIVKKHGYKVEIVKYFKKENDAFAFERKLQLKYERLGYELCNLAPCGEYGCRGLGHTKEAKDKISANSKKNWLRPDYRFKMTQQAKGLNNPWSDKKKYLFYHIRYGKVKCTQYELRNKYKVGCHLSDIVNGKRNNSNGWILFKNKDILIHKSSLIEGKYCMRIFLWHHKDYGTRRCGKYKFMKEFPKIDQSSLSRLINGECNHTHGWKIIGGLNNENK